jgi:hypothetical protein
MRPSKSEASAASVPTGEQDEPLVPAQVNLATYPWAPVRMDYFTAHLLALVANPEPFRALVLLMAQAWRQQPAMTLPDNDTQLAAMAGFGRDVAGWTVIRPEVLADWYLATDGRWHHPEFGGWALQAWDSKQKTDRSSEKQRERALVGVARRQSAAAVGLPSGAGHGPAAAQPYEMTEESEHKVDEKTHERERDRSTSSDSSPLPSSVGTFSSPVDQDTSTKEDSQSVGEVGPVQAIFEHWKQATARPDELLIESRKRVIQARLDEGVSPASMCKAIDFAAQDDFYQGRTAKSTRRQDTIAVICGSADRVLALASGARTGGAPQISMLKPAAQRTAETAAAVAARYDADVIDAEAPSVLTIEGSAA